eukprot:4898141-Ditylum_brightwellii.AAC.1
MIDEMWMSSLCPSQLFMKSFIQLTCIDKGVILFTYYWPILLPSALNNATTQSSQTLDLNPEAVVAAIKGRCQLSPCSPLNSPRKGTFCVQAPPPDPHL